MGGGFHGGSPVSPDLPQTAQYRLISLNTANARNRLVLAMGPGVLVELARQRNGPHPPWWMRPVWHSCWRSVYAAGAGVGFLL